MHQQWARAWRPSAVDQWSKRPLWANLIATPSEGLGSTGWAKGRAVSGYLHPPSCEVESKQVCQNNNASRAPVPPTLVPSWDSTLPVKSQTYKMVGLMRRDEKRKLRTADSESMGISRVIKSGAMAGRLAFPSSPSVIFFSINPSPFFLSFPLSSSFMIRSNQFKPEQWPLKSLYFRAKRINISQSSNAMPEYCTSLQNQYLQLR